MGDRSDRRHPRLPRRTALVRHADRAAGGRAPGAGGDRSNRSRATAAGRYGRPTTLNGVAARTRACATLSAAHLATTGPYLFPGDAQGGFDRLRGRVRDTIYGGDCHNYGLVASGHVDLVVEAQLKLYDFAALVPVVEGAGGRCATGRVGRLGRTATARSSPPATPR